jgi:hypothetical protein
VIIRKKRRKFRLTNIKREREREAEALTDEEIKRMCKEKGR